MSNLYVTVEEVSEKAIEQHIENQLVCFKNGYTDRLKFANNKMIYKEKIKIVKRRHCKQKQ